MPDGRVIIRISALPDSALRRALNGVVDDTRKVDERVASGRRRRAGENARAAREEAAAEKRATADSTASGIKGARDVEREKKRAARECIREAERASAVEQREAQKTARTQIREADRSARAQVKLARQAALQRRELGIALAGGAYGAVRGGTDLVQRGFGLAGVGSLEERLQTAGTFRQQLIRSAGEAGVSPEERSQVEARLLKASVATNISILDLSEGLATAQTRFDKFKEFSANIEDVAKAAAGTGEPIQDLIGAMGTAAEVFHLNAAEQKEFLDALISTSQRGTISVGDISTTLAPSMGSFAIAGKRTGIAGAREFLAAAQVAGTSQSGAAETRTKLNEMVRELNDVNVQALFKQIGIDVTETGKPGDRLRNIGDIASSFATNEQFQKPSVRQALFTRTEGREGAEFLMTKLQSDPAFFKNLESSRAGAGTESVDKVLGQLKNDPLFHLQNVGVRSQADTVRHADEIVAKITPAVTQLAKLQTKFPLLTESMGSLESAFRWAWGALLADRMLRGSGGALGGAGGGMGGAASEAGELFGKAGSLALGKNSSWLTRAAGTAGKALGGTFMVAAAGITSYEMTTALMRAMGVDRAMERVGSKLYDLLHPRPQMMPGGVSTTGSLSKDYARTTAAKSVAAQTEATEDSLGKFLGQSGPLSAPAGAVPGQAQPEAKITVKVEGPGQVTRIESTGFDAIETINNGRRDALPP